MASDDASRDQSSMSGECSMKSVELPEASPELASDVSANGGLAMRQPRFEIEEVCETNGIARPTSQYERATPEGEWLQSRLSGVRH